MTLVTRAEADRIEKAISDAERTTSGEIVAIIAGESGSYLYAPVMWAAIVALALPWPFIVWTWWPIQTIYALQIMAFAVLAALLSLRPLRYLLVPRALKHARAHRRALEQFLAQNLHTTDGRTGVLIFVSVAERYAEIIADAAIHARVPVGEWKAIVDRLTGLIAEGRPGDGFVEAVNSVGACLAQHFPPGAVDPNQLPNHLIVLGEP
jgi:putative membrane protein